MKAPIPIAWPLRLNLLLFLVSLLTYSTGLAQGTPNQSRSPAGNPSLKPVPGPYPAMACYFDSIAGFNQRKQAGKAAGITAAPPCDDYTKYAPIISNHTPIKYVRIAIHVLQDNNGNGNWQNTPTHLGILRGFIEGLTENGVYFNGVNGRYGGLQPSNQASTTSAYIPDSRIRFSLEDIYFHQNDNAWNQSNNNPNALDGEALYQLYVVNNSGLSYDKKNNVSAWSILSSE